MRQPGLHQGVITLPNVDRWVLRTPAERVESVREMMRIVRDTKFNKNHGANVAERPTIRVKACLQRASTQHSQQLLPLLWAKARRAPRDAVLLQTAKVALALPQLLSPSADSRAADPYLACNGAWERWPACNNRPDSKRYSSSCERVICRGFYLMAP